jgi:hypothetical protein
LDGPHFTDVQREATLLGEAHQAILIGFPERDLHAGFFGFSSGMGEAPGELIEEDLLNDVVGEVARNLGKELGSRFGRERKEPGPVGPCCFGLNPKIAESRFGAPSHWVHDPGFALDQQSSVLFEILPESRRRIFAHSRPRHPKAFRDGIRKQLLRGFLDLFFTEISRKQKPPECENRPLERKPQVLTNPPAEPCLRIRKRRPNGNFDYPCCHVRILPRRPKKNSLVFLREKGPVPGHPLPSLEASLEASLEVGSEIL